MKWQLDKTNTSLSIVCYALTIIGAIGAITTFTLHSLYPNKKDYDYIKYGIAITIISITILLIIFLVSYIISLKVKLKLSNIIIEGIQITSLGVANNLRKYNKDYKLHRVSHDVTIEGTSLIQDYVCSGIKIKNVHNNNSFDFSVDADTNLSLLDIDCYGYDLKNDPQKSRKIFPILKSTDSQSKKIQFSFLEEVKVKSDFSILVHTNIPDCMKKGKDYYLSSLSMDGNEKVDLLNLTLIFKNQLPQNVRVYEVLRNGNVKQLKTLTPDNVKEDEVIFGDKYREIGSIKYLVYIFDRPF